MRRLLSLGLLVFVVVGCSKKGATTSPSEALMALTPEESYLATLPSSTAIARDDFGKLQLLANRALVEKFARETRYNSDAALHQYDLVNHTQGLLTFGKNCLARQIRDLLAPMKAKWNGTREDFELMLLVDYSGSMERIIREVICGLVEINETLGHVKKAGFNMKIGIVTFGAPSREKLDLDLTSDFATVETTLRRLLDDYHQNFHSVEPGEAVYRGLELAMTKASWKAKNRRVLLFTDEGAYEVDKEPSTVARVNALLVPADKKYKTSVYSIVVAN